MINKVLKADCVGCKACKDICPNDAITFTIDHEGFWYPSIATEKCIACNLCETVCPALKKHESSQDAYINPKTYKVFHTDKRIRYNSTSGALYYSVAQIFVEKGDYIVGCVYNDGFTGAHHEVSNSFDGLSRIMRSKYFQSDTDGIYRKVKELLEKDKKVLFCGTGCQVGALYGFLRKKYENLYTIELICRGINSPLAFTSYLKELRAKYNSDIKDVHFKNKSHGWINLGTLVQFNNGKSYYRNRINDPWVNAFVAGNLYIRPSCARCKYKCFPRVADMTIGDFWGLSFSKDEKKYGVSLAIINTEKGDMLLQKARKNLVIEEHTLDEALKGNPALIHSVVLSPKRKEFFDRIKTEPYSKVVWNLLGSSALKRDIQFIKRSIKEFIHSLT